MYARTCDLWFNEKPSTFFSEAAKYKTAKAFIVVSNASELLLIRDYGIILRKTSNKISRVEPTSLSPEEGSLRSCSTSREHSLILSQEQACDRRFSVHFHHLPLHIPPSSLVFPPDAPLSPPAKGRTNQELHHKCLPEHQLPFPSGRGGRSNSSSAASSTHSGPTATARRAAARAARSGEASVGGNGAVGGSSAASSLVNSRPPSQSSSRPPSRAGSEATEEGRSVRRATNARGGPGAANGARGSRGALNSGSSSGRAWAPDRCSARSPPRHLPHSIAAARLHLGPRGGGGDAVLVTVTDASDWPLGPGLRGPDPRIRTNCRFSNLFCLLLFRSIVPYQRCAHHQFLSLSLSLPNLNQIFLVSSPLGFVISFCCTMFCHCYIFVYFFYFLFRKSISLVLSWLCPFFLSDHLLADHVCTENIEENR